MKIYSLQKVSVITQNNSLVLLFYPFAVFRRDSITEISEHLHVIGLSDISILSFLLFAFLHGLTQLVRIEVAPSSKFNRRICLAKGLLDCNNKFDANMIVC